MRRALLSVLALSLLAVPVQADDARETWVYERGEATHEVDVTGIAPELRHALHTQLAARGWVRREAAPAPAPEPAPEPEPEPGPSISESTRKDLEELVGQGGALPDGFRPSALEAEPVPTPRDLGTGALARVAGRLILRFVELKDDPVKGPPFAAVLADLARILVDAEAAGGPGTLALRLLGRIARGLGTPSEAAACAEILEIVAEAVGRPGAATAPSAGDLGGARIRLEAGPGGGLRVRIVDAEPGSLAARAGFRAGDRIEQIDGRAPDPAGLARLSAAFGRPGKLRVRVVRRNGKKEVLDVGSGPADRPAGGAPR